MTEMKGKDFFYAKSEPGRGFEISQNELHKRAREGAIELRKLLISLSTALLGFTYYLTIEGKFNKSTNALKLILISGIILLSISIGAGIIAWYSDAKRNYLRAQRMEHKENETKNSEQISDLYQLFKEMRKKGDWILRFGFILSVFLFSIYTTIYLYP